jgi:hypothetical protein
MIIMIILKESKNEHLKGIKSYCFLIKKLEKAHILYLTSTDEKIDLPYPIKYFY